MNNEFNWKETEYPCLGIGETTNVIVCFSSYQCGHVIDNVGSHYSKGEYSDIWGMDNFKPYTTPKPKIKLWYFEYMDDDGDWSISTYRMTEIQVKQRKHNIEGIEFRKIEALGFIEVEKE